VLESSPEVFGNKVTTFLQYFFCPWGDILPDLDWVRAYQELGIPLDPRIYPNTNPLYWHIPVLLDTTPNKVVATLRRLGVAVWTYTDDLDADAHNNDRVPRETPYVISVKRHIEADGENKNLSADQLKEQNIIGTTLLERLLLELAYYLTTRQHLDVEYRTLCSGSRSSNGHVPGVNWNSSHRRVYVDWYDPFHRSGYLRARTARQ
jgi:hypothetical protein